MEFDPQRCGARVKLLDSNIAKGNETGNVCVKGEGFSAGCHRWRVVVVKEGNDDCVVAGIALYGHKRYGPEGVNVSKPWATAVVGNGNIGNGESECELKLPKVRIPGDGWVFTLDCDKRQLDIQHLPSLVAVSVPLALDMGPLIPCVGFHGNTTTIKIEQLEFRVTTLQLDCENMTAMFTTPGGQLLTSVSLDSLSETWRELRSRYMDEQGCGCVEDVFVLHTGVVLEASYDEQLLSDLVLSGSKTG